MPFKPSITPGQGLLLLIQHCQDDSSQNHDATLEVLKSLLIRYVSDYDCHSEIIDFLSSHPLLNKYHLNSEAEAISSCPILSFFETQLAHETLSQQLEDLNYDELRSQYRRFVRYVLETNDKISAGSPARQTIDQVFAGECEAPQFDVIANTRISAHIKRIKDPQDTDNGFSDWDKEKIKWLLRNNLMARVRDWFALGSVICKEYNEDMVMQLNLMGVLAHIAEIHPNEGIRPSPFTQSAAEFAQYIRLFMATLMNDQGKTSLQACTLVFKSRKISNLLAEKIPGYSEIDFSQLFYVGNESAFDCALQDTINQNALILEEQCLSSELNGSKTIRLFKPIDYVPATSPAPTPPGVEFVDNFEYPSTHP